jgi:uncharacterized protein YbbK (DUF523 family)
LPSALMLAAWIDSFKPLRRSYNDVMSHDDRRPRVGVSRCLLGDEVRYDGGHKRDTILISTLGSLVEWVPVCPEVEAGLGTPREAIDLVARDDGVAAGAVRVRVLGVKSRTDWTATIAMFSAARVSELRRESLDGYVLKADSPSCGLEGVRVHRHDGVSRDGRGLFAQALVTKFPGLPVEEEGRLRDAAVRASFIDQVFERWRLRTGRSL